MSYKAPTATDLKEKLLERLGHHVTVEDCALNIRAVEYLENGTEETKLTAKRHQIRKEAFIEAVKAINLVYDQLQADAI